ncbi:TonB-dependent siderophore receptor [Hylemonella sp. W303a]|uniref:TonB-dependent siderophore receptor n=1 Tax=Hylemonella sp. W303a TaxID=3389873 RepID=UPI00396B09E1
MPRHSRPAERRLTLAIRSALLAVSLVAAVAPATAQTRALDTVPVQSYDIPAGPLGRNLSAFAVRAGIALSFEPTLTEGRSSPALSGNYPAREALQLLLTGSGLEIVARENGTYTLRVTPQSGATLPEVRVTVAAAKDGPTERTGSFTTGNTTAATGLNLSLRETPQSVTVITRARMDEAGISTLGDAIAQAPGIEYRPMGSSVGGYAPIYARGYTVQSLILDGLPIPPSAVTGWTIQGLGSLNTDVYDSVTIVRGATGLLTGAGDPSAAIALTRKRPTPEFQASVSQSLGSWQQRRTVGDAGGALNEAGTLRGRVVLAYESGAGWQEGYRYDNYVGYGVLEADLSDRTLATLAVELSGDNGWGGAGPTTGHALADSDGNRLPFDRHDNALAKWSGFEDRRTGLTAAVEHSFTDDLRIKAAYNRNQIKTEQRFGVTEQPDANGDAPLHLRGYRLNNVVDSLGVKLDGTYDLFGRKHELVAGFNGTWSEEKNPDWYMDWGNATANVYTWNRDIPEPDWDALYEFGGHTKTDQYGFYAATRLRATDQLSVLPGVRVSNWRSRDLDEDGDVTSDRKEKGVLTPYLGLVYDLTSNLSVYASYTTMFNPQSNRDVNGDVLDPEEGTNLETGVKGEWFGGRLNASVAVFQVKKDNLAVQDGTNQTPTGDDAYRAEDLTKGRGWEMEVAGEPIAGWRIQGGYTRVRTENRDGERLNVDQPERQAKLFTTVTPASLNQLTVGGGLFYQSAITTDGVDASLRDLYTQESYVVINVMARYVFTKQLMLTANLNNVFDKTYRTAPDQHEYGAPRNMYATLNYKF